VGLVYHGHEPWPDSGRRFGQVNVRLLPEVRSQALMQELMDRAGRMEVAASAESLSANARETDSIKQAAMTALGYRHDRVERFWELDLSANAAGLRRMAEASRARMREAGISVLTLDEDADPNVTRRLHRLNAEGEADIPTTVPIALPTYELFMLWFENPAIRGDRFWIARQGDEVLGLSVLAYPPSRGHVRTDFTAVARSARGLGIARALKLETLLQALEVGVASVRTENDSANGPILHLNQAMGYRLIPGQIDFLRDF
jgi:GNAT superfamily N-acetyltransferase